MLDLLKYKTMKKNLLFIISLVISMSAFAQREGKTKIGIGPTIGWATSNPLHKIEGNKGWGLGAGGVLTVEHFYKRSISGIAQAGIIGFAGRSNGSDSKNKGYTTIPIRAGANLYTGNLHFGALIGVGLNSFAGNSKTAFAYSPQVGYNFSRNDMPLDFSVSYDGYAGNGGFSALLFRLSLFF